MGCIYRIYNKINGKSYIGQYVKNDPKIRYTRHINDAKKDSKCILHLSFKKYGFENFSIETIITNINDRESLNNLECYYAEQYDSYIWDNGYNMILCGKGRARNPNHSEEHKLKMSKLMTGKIMSEETRQKLRESRLGTKCPWSEETRKRVSEISRKNKLLQMLSKEAKQKISNSVKEFHATEEGKEIYKNAIEKRKAFYLTPEGKEKRKMMDIKRVETMKKKIIINNLIY